MWQISSKMIQNDTMIIFIHYKYDINLKMILTVKHVSLLSFCQLHCICFTTVTQ